MRAGDSDRQYVADRLKEALDEGRLNLGEYDDRLQQAYAARTYGELDTLLHDLPGVTPPERSQVAPAPPPTRTPVSEAVTPRSSRHWMLALWSGWVSTTALLFVIWVLAGAHGFPWPLWVAGPWAAVMIGKTMHAVASGDPAGYAQADGERERERRQEHWQRRQERWERRRLR